MITIRIRNFRGCERADIECAPTALIGGRNAAGKSSLVQALAAALTGDALPLDGVGKGAAPLLVKQGAAMASIAIAGEEGEVHIEWPACTVTSTGKPPAASKWAVGLASLPLVAARDRAGVLSEYLHADPTHDDLAAAFGDAGFASSAVEAVWSQIEEQGWDVVAALRRERGAEMKGAWRQVTRQNWGSRIARSWQPANWDDAISGYTEAKLAETVETARRSHDEAVAAAAVSHARRADLEREVAELDTRKDSLRDSEQAAEKLGHALDQARRERASLPPTPSAGGLPCPHCGGILAIERVDLATTRLVAVEVLAESELKRRRVAIAEADGKIEHLAGEHQAAERAVERARGGMHDSLDARRRLEAWPAAETGGDVAGAKAALATAEERLNAWRQKHQADDLARRIAGNESLLDILAPDGLRAQKLARVLDAWNRGRLAELSAAAEWAAVTVAPDMTIGYGGRPYALLSTSEQYRVRAVLVAAMAELDGSAMLVFDAADVLDGPTRSGLFALIAAADRPALVAMTATRREQIPDLARLGAGRTWWLADGIAEPFAEAQAA